MRRAIAQGYSIRSTCSRCTGTNVIPRAVLAKSPGLATNPFDENYGFGLDFAVTMHARARGWLEGDGTMTWGGAAGTWFWVDPGRTPKATFLCSREKWANRGPRGACPVGR